MQKIIKSIFHPTRYGHGFFGLLTPFIDDSSPLNQPNGVYGAFFYTLVTILGKHLFDLTFFLVRTNSKTVFETKIDSKFQFRSGVGRLVFLCFVRACCFFFVHLLYSFATFINVNWIDIISIHIIIIIVVICAAAERRKKSHFDLYSHTTHRKWR